MPVLQGKAELVKFALPSTKDRPEADQAWVEMDISPLKTGDIIGFDPNGSQAESALAMLAARIKDWNYTDTDGLKLEINIDTVKRLDIKDFGFLAEKIPEGSDGLSVDEKKT